MERAVYRIIDANFNRAREALRVMEEFCRFGLNNSILTGRIKQFRHELSAEIAKLDSTKLIASRDTLGDVGVNTTVENQIVRGNLYDCFIAACKRLPEALRALSEVMQTINPVQSRTIENLRYNCYTLEKDIVLLASAAKKFKGVRLYVIITSNLPVEIISLTESCIAGGADCIQLRTKDIDDETLFAIAAKFVQLCRESSVISIINDRVDIAVAAEADGVHLGQNDLPVEQARHVQMSPLIIGKSTHSPQQLRLACQEHPTYAAMGPVFSTSLKPAAEPVGLDYVKQGAEMLSDTGIGLVAIGGITAENVTEVLKAGAKAIAVCSAVTQASDPKSACRKLKQVISSVID
jgi:thiamine-phosphate pyrophosphorylase